MNDIENEKKAPNGQKAIYDPTRFIDETFPSPKLANGSIPNLEIIKTKTPNDKKSLHDPTRFLDKRSPEDLGGLKLLSPIKKAYPFLTSKMVPLVLLGIIIVIGLSQQLPKLINTWELNDFMTNIPSVRSKNQYLEYIQNFGDYTFATRKVMDMSNAVILGMSDILLFTFCGGIGSVLHGSV